MSEDVIDSSVKNDVTWTSIIGVALNGIADNYLDGDLKKGFAYAIPLFSITICKFGKWMFDKTADKFDKEKQKEKDLKQLKSLKDYAESELLKERNKLVSDQQRIIKLESEIRKTDELIFQKIAE